VKDEAKEKHFKTELLDLEEAPQYQTTEAMMLLEKSAWAKGSCEDDTQYAASCPYWAGIGECSKSPAFMLVQCKKSCNENCGGGMVSCGNHEARTCEFCGDNASWCNGDCKWSRGKCQPKEIDCQWSSWSQCSKSCGTGKQSRSIEIQAQYGGRICTGLSQRNCNTHSCPIMVNCGTHEAYTCGSCTATKGPEIPSRCNGDCKWIWGQCVPKGHVICGEVLTTSCGACGSNYGEEACHGECTWSTIDSFCCPITECPSKGTYMNDMIVGSLKPDNSSSNSSLMNDVPVF